MIKLKAVESKGGYWLLLRFPTVRPACSMLLRLSKRPQK